MEKEKRYYGEDLERYYGAGGKRDAEKRAAELNETIHVPTEEDFKKKGEKYFNERLGSDEVLLGANHLFWTDRWRDVIEYGLKKGGKEFVEKELNYTRVSDTESYNHYFVHDQAEKETYTSGYSGTVSSDGHVSLSPDIGEYTFHTYIVCESQNENKFTAYYKVLKEKDVEEVKKAEKEVWKNWQRYEDAEYAHKEVSREVSTWEEVSPIVFFFKYGLFPLISIILMTFSALLFPKFDLLLPWVSKEPPFLWVVLRHTRLYTLRPYMAIVALGIALLLVMLLRKKAKVAYQSMYDRYMKSYNVFFTGMFIVAGCIVVSFLLGMVPEEVPDAGFILRMLLWLSWLLSNGLWLAAFVVLLVALWPIVRNGFGAALANKINRRVYKVKDYVATGQYENDKGLIEKIKSYTVKITAKNFEMPKRIDFTKIDLNERVAEKTVG